MLKTKDKLKIVIAVCIAANAALLAEKSQAVPLGAYEVGDFSSYNRDLSFGSGVDASNVTTVEGFNALRLKDDNEYVKTVGDLAGFTYQSDWSWMSIVKANQVGGFRVFMRGKAWQDKLGDFDLRLNPELDTMYTWHRSPWWRWVSANRTDSAINADDLLWLASTYDYSERKTTLYINGMNVAEFTIDPMDDRNNTNPLNINGQWAENRNGVGNVYSEGDFSLAQLILSDTLFTPDELMDAYTNRDYMQADANTWFDFRVKDTVPEPSLLVLLASGLMGLIGVGCYRRLPVKAET